MKLPDAVDADIGSRYGGPRPETISACPLADAGHMGFAGRRDEKTWQSHLATSDLTFRLAFITQSMAGRNQRFNLRRLQLEAFSGILAFWRRNQYWPPALSGTGGQFAPSSRWAWPKLHQFHAGFTQVASGGQY